MATYTEESVYLPSVTETYHIEVLRVDKVLKDGVVISSTNFRHVLAPGDDLTGQPTVVAAVANAVWTDDIIQKYQEMIAKQQEEENVNTETETNETV